MKKILFAFVLMFAMNVGASTASKQDINEFASIEGLESVELDEAAALRLRGIIPRIAARFCHLKVRPVYVTVSVFLIQVQWSLDRICGEAVPVEVVVKDELEETDEESK